MTSFCCCAPYFSFVLFAFRAEIRRRILLRAYSSSPWCTKFLSVGMDTCLSLEDNPGVPRFLLSTRRLHVAFRARCVCTAHFYVAAAVCSRLSCIVSFSWLPFSHASTLRPVSVHVDLNCRSFVARSDSWREAIFATPRPGNILAINRIPFPPVSVFARGP